MVAVAWERGRLDSKITLARLSHGVLTLDEKTKRGGYCAVIPDFYPVIPAKAGIQTIAVRSASRNKPE